MRLRFVLAPLFMTCGFAILSAQDQYIVKLNGDTVKGKLQINPLRDNTRSMYFKHVDGSKENIRPIRVSYVYYDDEYQFRSIPFNNQRIFMQIVKEDRNLSYYHYIHKRDNSVATTKVLAKPNGDALEISALSFRKQVTEFLDDCPQVEAKLEARAYKYKDIEMLLEDYNNCDILVVKSSTLNDKDTGTPAATTETTTAVAVAATAEPNGSPEPENNKKQERLGSIDDFRKYVRGLDDFEHARDVLEWLTDVEYRVSQEREIPNYLWNSLNAMATGNSELQQQANKLKQALEN